MSQGRIYKNNTTFQFFSIGAAAGLYPLCYLYSKNFTLINTWEHFLVFVSIALVIPGCITYFVALLLTKNSSLRKVVTTLNLFFFFSLVSVSIVAGFILKWILLSLLVAVLLGFVLAKYLQKILIFQLLLGSIAFVMFVPTLYKALTHSEAWKKLPDTIAEVTFVKTPNIYVIQPDGYANSLDLNGGYYNIDNSQFEGFLSNEGFTIYENFRSNYDATLSSNSSLFAMKHHYYQGDASNFEVLNARKNIVSDNPVLSILKKNNYQTFFVSESPYLLLNKPPLGFDKTNFSYSEIPYLSKGFDIKKEVLPDIAYFMKQDSNSPKFFFVQILNPKHIDGNTKGSNLVEKKRLIYKKNLLVTNDFLIHMIKKIKLEDPQALIVLLADHGGYVGLEYLQQGNDYTDDADKINSIFSAFLAIHWPNNIEDSYADSFKTNVNFFRILFTHLSGQPKFLEYLEEDASFMNISRGAPKGIYKSIDANGKVIFSKH